MSFRYVRKPHTPGWPSFADVIYEVWRDGTYLGTVEGMCLNPPPPNVTNWYVLATWEEHWVFFAPWCRSISPGQARATREGAAQALADDYDVPGPRDEAPYWRKKILAGEWPRESK